ncbi:DUF4221 family protein [Thermoflexibacter ruber]|uniref:DUF4221 domain-containing protein n=1 Tax=Thermoflexibacter ruber TaxID=1003 RepID=A0A1I2FV37_9BACT|nr:DUF4221 family protein [Thermoflexibacter ruber]SFF09242.1 protein of unknown function [Thermoflexibacter ruber]
MRIILYTFLATILFSCQKDKPKNTIPSQFTEQVFLLEDKVINFQLDSLTPFGSQSLQLLLEGDTSYLAYLNEQTGIIYLYNIENPKSVKQIAFLEKEKYFSKIHGMYIHSLDSIFIHNGYRLFLANGKGHIIRNYSLIDKSAYSVSSNPSIGTLTPAKLIGDTLYISAMPDKDFYNPKYFESEELKILLNVKDGRFRYTFSYPNSYQGYIWGTNLAYFFHTYNENTNNFVYSFSIDEKIYVTNHKNSLKSFYAGSKSFTNSMPMTTLTKDFQEQFEYYLSQPSYFAIYYDKYRKLYYRIAHHPAKEEDIISKSYIKQASIIILDSSFNKIGETLLPKYDFTETMCFINKDGLYIAKPNKNDENTLSFVLLKVVNKN